LEAHDIAIQLLAIDCH
jgi:hypothetical protein